MLNEQEKREHPRLVESLKVFEPNGKLLGVTKDISLGGCFIETKEHTNNAFNILFLLPQACGIVNALCEVKWSNNSGVGTALTLNTKNKVILSEWLFIKDLEFEQSRECRGKNK